LFLIISCEVGRRDKKSTSEPSSSLVIPHGGTVVIGIRSEPESLNPLFALSQSARNIVSLIFRRLADINEDLSTFSPQLARRWLISEDSLKITFVLRSDVCWHDGVPFTAEDVVFTYKMHTDPIIGWDGISYKENIKNVESLDDSTVVYSFRQKSRSMLMDAVEGYIVPKHLLGDIPREKMREANFNRRPIGTGPFCFSDWQTQQLITLENNKSFYEAGKPCLNRVIFKIVPENINLVTQLKSGELDLVEGIYPRDFQNLKADWERGTSAIRPVSYLGRRYDYIGWNLIDPEYYRSVQKSHGNSLPIGRYIKPHRLFGSQQVRSALTMAIDREALAKAVNYGTAAVMNGPIPLILSAYDATANYHWPYDLDSAKAILKREGWKDNDRDGILEKDGILFEFELVTEVGNLRLEQAATIIQDQLRKIGVHVIPRMVEPALLYGKLLPARDFDAALTGWIVGLKTDLAPLFHSSSFFTPFHYTGYYSAEFDRLDAELIKTRDSAFAQSCTDRIARLLSWDLPYTWLYYRYECTAVHKRFQGVQIDKRGVFINLENWWVPLDQRTRLDKVFEE
jgi:peptide/nickel transport system substrate-binding protein